MTKNQREEYEEETEAMKFQELIRIFHKQLVEYVNNNLLVSTWVNKDETISYALLEDSEYIGWQESLLEHVNIAKAIQNGEKRKATTLINKHLIHIKNRVISRM